MNCFQDIPERKDKIKFNSTACYSAILALFFFLILKIYLPSRFSFKVKIYLRVVSNNNIDSSSGSNSNKQYLQFCYFLYFCPLLMPKLAVDLPCESLIMS